MSDDTNLLRSAPTHYRICVNKGDQLTDNGSEQPPNTFVNRMQQIWRTFVNNTTPVAHNGQITHEAITDISQLQQMAYERLTEEWPQPLQMEFTHLIERLEDEQHDYMTSTEIAHAEAQDLRKNTEDMSVIHYLCPTDRATAIAFCLQSPEYEVSEAETFLQRLEDNTR